MSPMLLVLVLVSLAAPSSHSAPLHYGQEISVHSLRWGNHLSARGSGDHTRASLMSSTSGYEKWAILRAGDPSHRGVVQKGDQVLLHSARFRSYLSARGRGNHDQVETMVSPGSYEVWNFEVESGSETWVETERALRIRSVRFGGYLSARKAGDHADVEIMREAGGWERWTLDARHPPGSASSRLRYGDLVHLRSARWSSTLSARGNADHDPVEMMPVPSAYESWKVLHPTQDDLREEIRFGDPFVLRSQRFGTYLSGRGGGDHARVEVMRDHQGYEQWTFLAAAAPNSRAPIEMPHPLRLKSLRWGNYLSARGTAEHSPVELMATPSTYEVWYVATGDFLRNWMHYLSALHSKRLKDLCLPGAHDAGASKLTHHVEDGAEDGPMKVRDLPEDLPHEVDGMEAAGPAGALLKALSQPELRKMGEDLQSRGYPALEDLAQTTEWDIAHQLWSGIRALDLRAYLTPGGNFIHHTLVGPDLEGVLRQVRNFLASTVGEIVYVEISHYHFQDGFDRDQGIRALRDQVRRILGPYALRDQGVPAMEMSYQQIVQAGPRPGSKALIVMPDDPQAAQAPDLWSYDELWNSTGALPQPYSNTSSFENLLTDQRAGYRAVSGSQDPVQVSLTLTPGSAAVDEDGKEGDRIVRTRMAKKKGKWLVYKDAVLDGAAPWEGGWWTLRELSEPIRERFEEAMGQIHGGPEAPGRLSILWVDFPETLPVAQWAMRRSLAASSTAAPRLPK